MKVESRQKSFRLRYVRKTTKSLVLAYVPIIYSRFTIIVHQKCIFPAKVHVTYQDSERLWFIILNVFSARNREWLWKYVEKLLVLTINLASIKIFYAFVSGDFDVKSLNLVLCGGIKSALRSFVSEM